jgi:hypothetical protein
MPRIAVGGGASPGPPRTGLFIWYKADALTGYSHGDPVSQWTDSSGNGRHATSSGLECPLYHTNQIDGKPALNFPHFTGNNEQFHIPNVLTPLTAAEAFVVVKVVADPPLSNNNVWKMGAAAEQDHYPFSDGVIYEGWGSTVRKTTVNPTPSLATWRLYNVASEANNYTLRLDGTQIFNTLTNTVGWSTTPILGYALAGWIAEFIMYDRATSAADRTALHTYLRTKYPTLSLA